MHKKMNIEEVKNYIRNTSEDSKIYIGADSERYRKHGEFWADYAVCVAIHVNGNRGCKIFGEVVSERDYDQKKNKPSYRLMNEVYKAAELYLALADAIGDRHCEVHLDINPNLLYGSSCVLNQAIGYIKASCGIDAKVKPEAPVASYAADRLKDIIAT